jgi:hypothetical protein
VCKRDTNESSVPKANELMQVQECLLCVWDRVYTNDMTVVSNILQLIHRGSRISECRQRLNEKHVGRTRRLRKGVRRNEYEGTS